MESETTSNNAKAIWSNRSTYGKPKLWITTLTMAFAASIGNLVLATNTSLCARLFLIALAVAMIVVPTIATATMMSPVKVVLVLL